MAAAPVDATARAAAPPGRERFLACAVALLLAAPFGVVGDELGNWFDDPFIRISSGVADCPLPAGPFVGDADRQRQSHHRAEKGTGCWLAKECDRPSSYAYDADIAAALRTAIDERHPFGDTSLWFTIQGRVVYIEGCVARPSQAGEVEAFARALPHVQQAIAIVRSDASAPPPYRLRVPP